MLPLDPRAEFETEIRHAAYMVRHYQRPGQELRRAQALQRMGLAARAAFNAAEQFEDLLYAIADGLYPFEAARHDSRRR